jgi:hypothetical protein
MDETKADLLYDVTFYLKSGLQFTVTLKDWHVATCNNDVEKLTWENAAQSPDSALQYISLGDISAITSVLRAMTGE